MSGRPPKDLRVNAMPAAWRGLPPGWIDIHFFVINDDRTLTIAEPMTFRKTEEVPSHFGDATLTVAPEDAQKFMDALWSAGIRPADGHGSAGQREALEKHLNDMRAIVGKQLDVELKP